MSHLVYLHGFLSSPQSLKAQQTLTFAKRYYPSLTLHMPVLSGNVNKALATVEHLIATLPKGQANASKLRFIGSSMGGYLATYCVEKYGGKAVLVNPAVKPFELLRGYMGTHINPNTSEIFSIHRGHIQTLRSIYQHTLHSAGAYKVLLQTGDETLPYKDAELKYSGGNLVIEQGGDHSFVHYDQHLPSIFNFLR